MKFLKQHHFWYYFSLFWVLALSLLAAQAFSYDKHLQLTALFAAIGFYVIWGIVHQYLHHHLRPKNIIEYALIGTLGCVLLLLIYQV